VKKDKVKKDPSAKRDRARVKKEKKAAVAAVARVTVKKEYEMELDFPSNKKGKVEENAMELEMGWADEMFSKDFDWQAEGENDFDLSDFAAVKWESMELLVDERLEADCAVHVTSHVIDPVVESVDYVMSFGAILEGSRKLFNVPKLKDLLRSQVAGSLVLTVGQVHFKTCLEVPDVYTLAKETRVARFAEELAQLPRLKLEDVAPVFVEVKYEMELENGMRVVLEPKHLVPVAMYEPRRRSFSRVVLCAGGLSVRVSVEQDSKLSDEAQAILQSVQVERVNEETGELRVVGGIVPVVRIVKKSVERLLVDDGVVLEQATCQVWAEDMPMEEMHTCQVVCGQKRPDTVWTTLSECFRFL
jgi:hypothetical protein